MAIHDLTARDEVRATLKISEFDEIHQALAKCRKSGKSVTIPKELLEKLLSDHSRVVAALGSRFREAY